MIQHYLLCSSFEELSLSCLFLSMSTEAEEAADWLKSAGYEEIVNIVLGQCQFIKML